MTPLNDNQNGRGDAAETTQEPARPETFTRNAIIGARISTECAHLLVQLDQTQPLDLRQRLLDSLGIAIAAIDGALKEMPKPGGTPNVETATPNSET